jgi:polysaccharide deacetylase family protein (PEP-CTERM system associated)
VKNALSIDLEEWFCGHILEHGLSRKNWDRQELRVVGVTRLLLKILQRHRTKATFFILGWLAEREPELVNEIEALGHEIGTHGYSHTSLTKMTADEFEADLTKALKVTRKYIRGEILGFRAPHFTITKKTMWALDILVRHGIKYDSSVFPIGLHPDYGISDAQLDIYRITPDIIEVPLSTVSVLGVRIPCGGGGYFRLYPYRLTKSLLDRCNRKGRPVVFYLHPWELDPHQPRLKLPYLSRFRHYNNLDKTSYRLNRLLEDFEFTTIREVLGL